MLNRMQLFLDIGNTALKWRWRHGEAILQGGCAHHRDWTAQLAALAAAIPSVPQAIAVASVAGREADEYLRLALREAFGCTPQFYYSPSSDAGVRNAYLQPERLGVDRWLAMVEAWHRSGASIIIDCGSALTLDLVGADGVHAGGYIVPGLRMLENSLVSGTGSISLDHAGERAMDAGKFTVSCVQNGVLRMSVSFITDAVVALRNSVQDTCSIFITGGDANTLLPYLDFAVLFSPDLVLDGLERVCAQNQ